MRSRLLLVPGTLSCLFFAATAYSQHVTYAPYIQPGENGHLGAADQVVIAWQTDETAPHNSDYHVEYGEHQWLNRSAAPAGRIVDNYLAADPAVPAIPTAYGPHTNYMAVLTGLRFDTKYSYKVTGPGLPADGFTASFHTRKKGGIFSFAVEGDEGSFPAVPNSNPATIVDYEARIAHLIYNSGNLSVSDVPSLPPADFVVNTGDNIYTYGAEDNYRDFFFPVLNSDQDSNETGAPLLRSMFYYVVPGNHDVGSTGVTANIMGTDSAPLFSGNQQGGDALAYFNNFYYPLNGPSGVDIGYTWASDSAVANGLTLSYKGNNYTSSAAIEALRASTTVDYNAEPKRQIDHMSNYSFDYGNAHFVFLDANPHLFDGELPGGSASTVPYPPAFTPYPAPLKNWLLHDLDASKQTWKIVLFHQPSFSSGDATILNNQMRAVAKYLQDHGVNVVFNGHEHNYQRTLPIRATARTAAVPSTIANGPAVHIDQSYNGKTRTVPDGVLYIVEGAGGNRDFDGNFAPPRGSGVGVDQDDSATGTFTPTPGLTVEQGPADWLDTNLTNLEMVNNFPNAGTGPKITTKFKSKVFSFGHVVVDRNRFTLYQISEPLKSSSSATSGNPTPYGTDIDGSPLNDPIDDTVLDAATGALKSAPSTGQPALLDQWTITKPRLKDSVSVHAIAHEAGRDGILVYKLWAENDSRHALNGAQFHLRLPEGASLLTPESDTLTLNGSEVVYTIGRLDRGSSATARIKVSFKSGTWRREHVHPKVSLTSGTALPVFANERP